MIDCEIYSDHSDFVHINDFTFSHLPDGYRDKELLECIRTTAGLTVRVDSQLASAKRPEFWPDNSAAGNYPYYEMRESQFPRTGTGVVSRVFMWTGEHDKGTCPCRGCRCVPAPSTEWGEVWTHTANHVVFDDREASYTTCRLFYDSKDSPPVTVDGCSVVRASFEGDKCMLKCVSCDLALLDRLDQMLSDWSYLRGRVNRKFQSSRDADKLTIIVSHPHGWPKRVTVGKWIQRFKVGKSVTKYMYTTSTCPGSGGAYVHPLGYGGRLNGIAHVHSGINADGISISSMGEDVF